MMQNWCIILCGFVLLVFIIFKNPFCKERWYRLNKYRYFSDVFTKEFQEKFGIEIFVQIRFFQSRIILVFDVKDNDWRYNEKHLPKVSRSAFINGERNRYDFGSSFVFFANHNSEPNKNAIYAFLLKDGMAVLQIFNMNNRWYGWKNAEWYEKTGTLLFLVQNVLFVCRPGKPLIYLENVEKFETWAWSNGRTEGVPYRYVRYNFFLYQECNETRHLCNLLGQEILFPAWVDKIKTDPKFDQELCIWSYMKQNEKGEDIQFYVVYNIKNKTWSQEKKYVKVMCFEREILFVELTNEGYLSTIVSRDDFGHKYFECPQMISCVKRAKNVIALRTSKPEILLLDSEFNIMATIDKDQGFSEISWEFLYGETLLKIKIDNRFFLWNIQSSSKQFPWTPYHSICLIDPQKKIVGLEIEKDVLLGFSLQEYKEVSLTNYVVK